MTSQKRSPWVRQHEDNQVLEKQETCLSKVVADDLENNQFSSLVQFLTSTSSGPFVQRGKVISVTGITRKKVKFLLNKFLHANHLSEHRVLDHGDALEIVNIRTEQEQRTRKSLPLKHPVPTDHESPASLSRD